MSLVVGFYISSNTNVRHYVKFDIIEPIVHVTIYSRAKKNSVSHVTVEVTLDEKTESAELLVKKMIKQLFTQCKMKRLCMYITDAFNGPFEFDNGMFKLPDCKLDDIGDFVDLFMNMTIIPEE